MHEKEVEIEKVHGISDSNENEDKSSLDYKTDKFKALYQCRAILAKHGTMQERQICGIQLKRMKRLGIGFV